MIFSYLFLNASHQFRDSFIWLCCVRSFIIKLSYRQAGRCLCIVGGLFTLLVLMGCMTLILISNGRFIFFYIPAVVVFAPLIDAFSILIMRAGRLHYSVQPISGRFACPIALGFCPCSVLCFNPELGFDLFRKFLVFSFCVLKSCIAFGCFLERPPFLSAIRGSRKLYSRAWTVFREFCVHFVSPHSFSLPLSTTTIALFVSYLRARKLAPSTISSYLSAISYVHKIKDLRDPTKEF